MKMWEKVRDERGETGCGVLVIWGLLAFAAVGVTFWVLFRSIGILDSIGETSDQYLSAWENGEVTQGEAEKVGEQTTIGQKLAGKETFIVLVRYTVDGTAYECKYLIDSKAFDGIDGTDQDGKGAVEVHYDPSDPAIAMIEAAANGGKVLLNE